MPATKTDNMLSSLRLGVIERLALSFWAGTLPEDVDRIPLLMRPRGSEIMSRCCIYKDRAILRERLRAAMGFRLEDETDDSIPPAHLCRRGPGAQGAQLAHPDGL